MNKIEIEETQKSNYTELKAGKFYKNEDGEVYLACQIDHSGKCVLVGLETGNRWVEIEHQEQQIKATGVDGWTELASGTIIKITV